MKSIGARIKKQRKIRKLTQHELAVAVGTTKAAVSRWETDKNSVAATNLELVASILDVDVEWLLTGESEAEREKSIFWAPFCSSIEAAAGDGVLNPDVELERFPIPRCSLRYQNDQEQIFCVVVKGDSMEPVLYDGSIIAVNGGNRDIRDGRMYLLNQNGLLRVKILQTRPGELVLKSYNSNYKDEIHSCIQDDDEFLILGEVFWYSSMTKQ
ncbi:XRE family transcriptional regulator [Vibrio mediterranei]|uniref:Phage repressor protein n=1 Tax=Vibrio mediterranei TaxID=689 RepID=A0ABX5D6S6_9VIBR|nr:helix-turn-helix transcriptional regulator [Vibrio mediterranei]PCD85531.1 phage repressor protein [Vibrio mediterranei]PRQ65380.1 phage repressor protein [Vibrio mediterranei]